MVLYHYVVFTPLSLLSLNEFTEVCYVLSFDDNKHFCTSRYLTDVLCFEYLIQTACSLLRLSLFVPTVMILIVMIVLMRMRHMMSPYSDMNSIVIFRQFTELSIVSAFVMQMLEAHCVVRVVTLYHSAMELVVFAQLMAG